ncbi:MAG TPA: hypothetical protein VFO31_16310 [Vicinamibacterales bacterium]|nr:hypothetical protein [Vicinamibacterales bacterium]
MRRGSRLMRAACQPSLILLALTLSAAPAFAQSLVCHPIRRGESAGQAARRVTGDSRNAYRSSFQIMNGSSRFIPKSQYNRLHPGWRACVVGAPAPSPPLNGPRLDRPELLAVAESVTGTGGAERGDEADEVNDASAPQIASTPLALAAPIAAATATPLSRRRIGNVDLTFVWLATAIAVPWFGLQIVDGYLTRRRTATVLMQHFAHRFISEFERPLARYDDTEPPLKTRVRSARRGRFDILLAPGPGRRYPNLTDHKRNVEYDVSRVLAALDDHFFVDGALYTQAEWVVVPFQPRTGPKQPGVTCISSF